MKEPTEILTTIAKKFQGFLQNPRTDHGLSEKPGMVGREKEERRSPPAAEVERRSAAASGVAFLTIRSLHNQIQSTIN